MSVLYPFKFHRPTVFLFVTHYPYLLISFTYTFCAHPHRNWNQYSPWSRGILSRNSIYALFIVAYITGFGEIALVLSPCKTLVRQDERHCRLNTNKKVEQLPHILLWVLRLLRASILVCETVWKGLNALLTYFIACLRPQGLTVVTGVVRRQTAFRQTALYGFVPLVVHPLMRNQFQRMHRLVGTI